MSASCSRTISRFYPNNRTLTVTKSSWDRLYPLRGRCLSSSTMNLQNETDKSNSSEIVSSIKAGTPLKGLGYIKGVGDPIAKEDHEYPDWLWSLAEPDMGIGRDDSTLRSVKRQLNLENRKSIRKSNFLRAKK